MLAPLAALAPTVASPLWAALAALGVVFAAALAAQDASEGASEGGDDGETGSINVGRGCGWIVLAGIALLFGLLLREAIRDGSWGFVAVLLGVVAVVAVVLLRAKLAMTRRQANAFVAAGKGVLVLGLACFLSSCAMNLDVGGGPRLEARAGGDTLRVRFPAAGAYDVEMRQTIRGTNYWSFVTVEVLDDDGDYLTGFGVEFWHESGYDEGRWEESDTRESAFVTIPKAGTYTLAVLTESNADRGRLSPIQMAFERTLGDPGPLRTGGWVALVLGVALWAAGGLRSPGARIEVGDTVIVRRERWTAAAKATYDYEGTPAYEWTLKRGRTRRYLEMEVDEGSITWSFSEPIDTDDLQAEGRALADHLDATGTLPAKLTYDGDAFQRRDTGRATYTADVHTDGEEAKPSRDLRYAMFWSRANRFVALEYPDLPDHPLRIGMIDAVVGRHVANNLVEVIPHDADETVT